MTVFSSHIWAVYCILTVNGSWKQQLNELWVDSSSLTFMVMKPRDIKEWIQRVMLSGFTALNLLYSKSLYIHGKHISCVKLHLEDRSVQALSACWIKGCKWLSMVAQLSEEQFLNWKVTDSVHVLDKLLLTVTFVSFFVLLVCLFVFVVGNRNTSNKRPKTPIQKSLKV